MLENVAIASHFTDEEIEAYRNYNLPQIKQLIGGAKTGWDPMVVIIPWTSVPAMTFPR